MHRHPRRHWGLAVCLAGLAGYVDAVGYLQLHGFFVSFMSGNSTRFAIGLVSNATAAAVAGGLILCFVTGVVTGSLIGHAAAGRYRSAAVLGYVTACLTAAALAAAIGNPAASAIAMALAMGAENTIFERDGEVSIAVTYMTGTIVKFGQRLAAAMLGGPRWAWMPYLMLWVGLVAGAVCGAVGYRAIGLDALAVPALAGAGLTALVFVRARRRSA